MRFDRNKSSYFKDHAIASYLKRPFRKIIKSFFVLYSQLSL